MRLKRSLVILAITLLGAASMTGNAFARPKPTAPSALEGSARVHRAKTAGPWVVSPVPAPRLATLLDPPPNDVCAGAIPIPCGNVSISGSTFTATNNYDFADTTLSCTGYSAGGRDVVYSINAQAGDSLWLDYTSTADASAYIVTNCANVQGASCIYGQDETEAGQTEKLRVGFHASGTYYLILDSYNPDSYGDWTIAGQFISCGIFPPVNDRCATATKLYCGLIATSGSTATAFNDYHFPTVGGNCANSTANGRDIVFRLDVNAGDSLAVYYTSSTDGVMYIMADCSGAGGLCFAGTNETGVGGQEAMLHRFVYAGTYYLVLDSNGTDTFGTWNLFGDLFCVNGPPGNDQCAGSTLLTCGPIDLAGSTSLALNDYSLTEDGCTGFETQGNDVVYRINAAPGESLWVNYRNQFDGAIYLVTDCSNLDSTCVYGVDLSSTDEVEYLQYKFTERRTYYLILDTYDFNSGGTWTAVGELLCPQVAGVDSRGPTSGLDLRSIVPNPFLETSTVRFSLATPARVTLRIYDLAGRVVRTLVNGEVSVGDHAVAWDARDDSGAHVGPGTYYARLSDGGKVAQAKLVFVR